MKIKKKIVGGSVRGRGGRVWGEGQGGCERRMEVFVKIKKKIGGRGPGGGHVGGVRVDVYEELKFLCILKKYIFFFGGGGGGSGGGGRVGGGVRLDVNEELKFL